MSKEQSYFFETLANIEVSYLGENLDSKKVFSYAYDVFDNIMSNTNAIVTDPSQPCITGLDSIILLETGVEIISAFFKDFVSPDNAIFTDRLTETECMLFSEDMDVDIDNYISSNKCHINITCYGFSFELVITISHFEDVTYEEY